jgi:hypothetical protein
MVADIIQVEDLVDLVVEMEMQKQLLLVRV